MKRRMVGIIASCFFLGIAFAGCDLAGNEEVRRVDSPDGRYSAVIFVRSAGATTGFGTQVSIIKRGAKLGGGLSNIFISDRGHRAKEFKNFSLWIKLKWISPTELLIRYDQNVRVFLKNEKYKSIRVRYETVEVSPTSFNDYDSLLLEESQGR